MNLCECWNIPERFVQLCIQREFLDVLGYTYQELFATRLQDADETHVDQLVALGTGALKTAYDFNPCSALVTERRLDLALRDREEQEPALVTRCRAGLRDTSRVLFPAPLPSSRLFRLALARRSSDLDGRLLVLPGVDE